VGGEKEEYMLCMKGSGGLAWLVLGIWELRVLQRGVGKQDVTYIERKGMTFIDC
jgi:hypothetical protein